MCRLTYNFKGLLQKRKKNPKAIIPSRRVGVLCIMRAFYLHGQMKKTSFIGDEFF